MYSRGERTTGPRLPSVELFIYLSIDWLILWLFYKEVNNYFLSKTAIHFLNYQRLFWENVQARKRPLKRPPRLASLRHPTRQKPQISSERFGTTRTPILQSAKTAHCRNLWYINSCFRLFANYNKIVLVRNSSYCNNVGNLHLLTLKLLSRLHLSVLWLNMFIKWINTYYTSIIHYYCRSSFWQ